MNVLEKILEEIEHEIMTNKEIGRKQCDEMARAMNIIHSHMDDDTISKMENVRNDGWIPVSERLPDKGIYVMCCFDDGTVDVLWQNWQEDKSLLFYADIDKQIRKVVAWQPLPEPYKED